MKPAEVLDHQADLADRATNPDFRDIVVGTMTASYADDPYVATERSVKMSDAVADQFATRLPLAVRAAEAFHVTPDMSIMVQHIATQLDGTDRFNFEALPSTHGIARFDEPLPMRDIRGKLMLIHWAVWARTANQSGYPVLMLWFFNDWDFPDAISSELLNESLYDADRMRKIQGRWGFISVDYITDQQRMGPAFVEIDDETRARVIASGIILGDGTLSRYMHAFFLLLGQTVTKLSKVEADRKFARRARRAKLPSSRVTVVAMRRTEYLGEGVGERDVEWSHRWSVRAHLRWQHVGPDYPGAKETSPGVFMARIVIGWHIKGPPDKPLILTQKVYDLRR